MKDVVLPARLKSEPLVDVVFEVRFASDIAASSLLPGLIISSFPDYKKFERLPAADIPEVVRTQEPTLAFAPLMRLSAGRFTAQVGDRMFALSCQIPYIGWAAFKQEILKLSGLISSCQPISQITRYALRYVNLLEIKGAEAQVAAFNWNVRLGNHEVVDQATLVRMEIREGNHGHALQVATGATTLSPAGAKTGAIVDIDSYSDCQIDRSSFLSDLDVRLDRLHRENHIIFFSTLTAATLNSLGPEYDKH